MGIGGYHELPEIGRVGKDFLVAGHPGIETHLPKGGSFFISDGFPVENGAIRQ